MVVEAVTAPVVHGEGPHWAAPFLYFVDISSSALHRLDTSSSSAGNLSSWTVAPGDGAVSLAVPLASAPHRRLVISRDRQLLEFDADTGAVGATLADADAGRPGNRFNDGKVDPSGRLWAGTQIFK